MRKHIAGLILAALFIAACGNSSKDEKGALNDKKAALEKLKKDQASLAADIKKLEDEIGKQDTSAAKLANARLVSVTSLTTQDFVHYIDLQGKIDAENISYVSPRLGPGLVKAVYVTKGQQVRKGQLLLKLDDAVQKQSVAAASQGLESLRTQLALAKEIYNRQNNLWKQGIGTEVQLLQARTNVKALENQIEAGEANVKTLQEQAGATNVKAEVDGVADEVNIRAGETFTGFAGNTPQIKIVNTSSLKAVVEVPENYAAKVKNGAPVVVTVPDIGKSFSNIRLTRSGELIDPSSRTFTAEARVPYDALIRPNQIAQIRIQDYAVRNTIAVPVNTVQTDEKGKYVFVSASENGRTVARKRVVAVGELNGDLIEIKSGLQAGDQLITEGYQNLYEGQVITLAK